MRGVRFEADSVDEFVAFCAWQRRRTFEAYALRALVAAPIDAEIMGNKDLDGKHDAHHRALKKALFELMPETQAAEADLLAQQKKVLAAFKDKPIRLNLGGGPDGTLSVSMENPL